MPCAKGGCPPSFHPQACGMTPRTRGSYTGWGLTTVEGRRSPSELVCTCACMCMCVHTEDIFPKPRRPMAGTIAPAEHEDRPVDSHRVLGSCGASGSNEGAPDCVTRVPCSAAGHGQGAGETRLSLRRQGHHRPVGSGSLDPRTPTSLFWGPERLLLGGVKAPPQGLKERVHFARSLL